MKAECRITNDERMTKPKRQAAFVISSAVEESLDARIERCPDCARRPSDYWVRDFSFVLSSFVICASSF